MLIGRRDYKSKYQAESPEERIKTKKEFKLIIRRFLAEWDRLVPKRYGVEFEKDLRDQLTKLM